MTALIPKACLLTLVVLASAVAGVKAKSAPATVFAAARPCHYASPAAVVRLLRRWDNTNRRFRVGAGCDVLARPDAGGSEGFVLTGSTDYGYKTVYKFASPRSYFRAVVDTTRQEVATDDEWRLAQFHAVPGVRDAYYFRTVYRDTGKLHSQWAILLRGVRVITLTDNGYGWGSGSLLFLPRSVFFKVAAQIR